EPDLVRRDSGDLLPAQLAGELEERGTQAVRDRHRIHYLPRRRCHSLTRLAKRLTRLTISLLAAGDLRRAAGGLDGRTRLDRVLRALALRARPEERHHEHCGER